MRLATFLVILSSVPACTGTVASGVHRGSGGSGGSSAGTTSGSGGTTTSDTGGTGTGSTTSVVCTYPPVDNPPGCPASYSVSDYYLPCPQAGLTCQYPGAGDGLSNGCQSTAYLWCNAPLVDAGTPRWDIQM